MALTGRRSTSGSEDDGREIRMAITVNTFTCFAYERPRGRG